MSNRNGDQPSGPLRRRVLVIGGKEKNIPVWARNAFDIELIDQQTQGGKGRLDTQPADAIVVCTIAVSHNFSKQAHEMGRVWGVPVLKARDGWSSAVQDAARVRADWFVDAVQMSGEALVAKNPPRAQEALETVDNAWKALAEGEREKADAAIKRMAKLETKLNKVEEAYNRLRSGAQERVLQEIRQRAAELRREMRAPVIGEAAEIVDGVIDEFDAACASMREKLEEIAQRLKDEVDSGPGDDGE